MKSGWLISLAITAWLGGLASIYSQQEPLPTRWHSPDQPLPPVHDAPVEQGPLHLDAAQADAVPSATGTNRVCLVVEDALYAGVSNNLTRFALDLEAAGYTPILYRFVSGTAADLRGYLMARYQESASLEGVFLIGHVPYIVMK